MTFFEKDFINFLPLFYTGRTYRAARSTSPVPPPVLAVLITPVSYTVGLRCDSRCHTRSHIGLDERSAAGLYTGRSDVTESMAATRSPFCGYDTIRCIELNGEDLSCCSNKNESVRLKMPI